MTNNWDADDAFVMDSRGLFNNRSATDLRKDIKVHYDKAHSKKWFADENMRNSENAYKEIVNDTTKKAFPSRTYKKAKDWLDAVKKDYALINAKMWHVNEKWRQANATNTTSKLKGYIGDMRGAANDIEGWGNEMRRKRERLEGEVSAFKSVILAPVRGAYLSLIQLNYRGLASRIYAVRTKSPKEYSKILNVVKKMGGDTTKYQEAINRGKSKKPLLGKPKSFDGFGAGGDTNPEYIMDSRAGVTLAGVTTFVATATPIITATLGLLKNIVGDKEPSEDTGKDKKDKDTGEDTSGDTSGNTSGNTSVSDFPMWGYLAIGGILLTVFTIILIPKKK